MPPSNFQAKLQKWKKKIKEEGFSQIFLCSFGHCPLTQLTCVLVIMSSPYIGLPFGGNPENPSTHDFTPLSQPAGAGALLFPFHEWGNRGPRRRCRAPAVSFPVRLPPPRLAPFSVVTPLCGAPTSDTALRGTNLKTLLPFLK